MIIFDIDNEVGHGAIKKVYDLKVVEQNNKNTTFEVSDEDAIKISKCVAKIVPLSNSYFVRDSYNAFKKIQNEIEIQQKFDDFAPKIHLIILNINREKKIFTNVSDFLQIYSVSPGPDFDGINCIIIEERCAASIENAFNNDRIHVEEYVDKIMTMCKEVVRRGWLLMDNKPGNACNFIDRLVPIDFDKSYVYKIPDELREPKLFADYMFFQYIIIIFKYKKLQTTKLIQLKHYLSSTPEYKYFLNTTIDVPQMLNILITMGKVMPADVGKPTNMLWHYIINKPIAIIHKNDDNHILSNLRLNVRMIYNTIDELEKEELEKAAKKTAAINDAYAKASTVLANINENSDSSDSSGGAMRRTKRRKRRI